MGRSSHLFSFYLWQCFTLVFILYLPTLKSWLWMYLCFRTTDSWLVKSQPRQKRKKKGLAIPRDCEHEKHCMQLKYPLLPLKYFLDHNRQFDVWTYLQVEYSSCSSHFLAPNSCFSLATYNDQNECCPYCHLNLPFVCFFKHNREKRCIYFHGECILKAVASWTSHVKGIAP